ncbi:MAG: heparinase II/III domain-containing protein, partial [Bacteroidales bacterium]
MIIRRHYIFIIFLALASTYSLGQQQGLVHPWMIFNNNDIPAIKTKLAMPANAAIYKTLGSGTGLKYILYGDLTDLADVKKNCFNLVLSARSRMVSTDAYAPFQWGRRMQELIIPISLVINNTSSPYTAEEIARLRLSCDSIAWRFRDSTYSEVAKYHNINNRTVDEIMGVAFAGVFMFPDNPNAANHYAYVKQELTRHLADIGADGVWPETTRYVGQAILRCFLLFSRVEKNYLGNTSGLISDPRLVSVIEGLMLTVCPKDILNGNARYAPAIGDAGWGDINFTYLRWAAAEMSSIDLELSKELMGIWKMSKLPYSDGVYKSYELILTDAEALAQTDTSFVLPSVIQKNIGYYIFRNNFGTSSESYLITRLPNKYFGHRHFDCGAFSFFANNTPLMLDAGVGLYANPDASFYQSTVNHNVVCFKDVNGLNRNGLDQSALVLDTLLSADYDFVSANITPPYSIANKYIRSTAFLKKIFNSVILYDYVDSNTGMQHSNNLHTFSTSTDKLLVNGFNKTISHGYNGLDIEIDHLLPLSDITFSTVKFSSIDIPTSWPRNLANRKDVADMGNC